MFKNTFIRAARAWAAVSLVLVGVGPVGAMVPGPMEEGAWQGRPIEEHEASLAIDPKISNLAVPNSHIIAVAAGARHTCALTTEGGVKCWGSNSAGQLGDGTIITRSLPVDVIGLNTGVIAIAAGFFHTCALTTSGGAKCWGSNGFGRLGDGTTERRLTPVDVIGLNTGVIAIAAGNAHTCAIVIGGGVKCWGFNSQGQLGDGTGISSLTPVDVISLTASINVITTGEYHTCAVTTNGGAKCWGDNSFGQIGDGTPGIPRLTPVDVNGMLSGVKSITAGGAHTCAVTILGGAKCWGYNASGQLGNGNTFSQTEPVDVINLTTGVSATAAGYYFTCAMTTNGGAKCWGFNAYGQLGDGTTIDSATPVDVTGLNNGLNMVSAGAGHACSVDSTNVKCWGLNYFGELGDGTFIDRHTPVNVIWPRTPIIFIPGFMGSKLFNNQGEVWADVLKIIHQGSPSEQCPLGFFENPLMVLRLSANGASAPCADPRFTTVATRAGTTGTVLSANGDDVYGSLVSHFTDGLGYTEGVDFWAYTYDWRKDVTLAASGLNTLIDNIREQTGAAKVQIVAHSLGTVVTRQYLANATHASKVKQVVLFNGPLLGAPKTYAGLVSGICIHSLWDGICAPRQDVVFLLSKNYPGFYQVAPSRRYFELSGGFYRTNSPLMYWNMPCSNCLSFDETYTTSINLTWYTGTLPVPLMSNLNPPLLNAADSLHAVIDDLDSWNGVSTTLIVGNNSSTILGVRGKIILYNSSFYNVNIPVYAAAGDGSVPAISQRTGGSSSAQICEINVAGAADGHMALVQSAAAWPYMDSVLDIGPAYACPGSFDGLDRKPLLVDDGAITEILATNVARIDAYDNLGNHTGPLSNTTQTEIGGSNYFAIANLASTALLGGNIYTITLQPTGTGPLDLTVMRAHATSNITSTLFLGLSVTAQSRITLVGDPYQSDSWFLDLTGQGNPQPLTPTTIITAGTTPDLEPPTSTITLQGQIGPQGWYISPVTVTLSASDNVTGTGIAYIEYGLSSEPTRTHLYTGPFVVSPETVRSIAVWAHDKQTNMQWVPTQAYIGPAKVYLPYARR